MIKKLRDATDRMEKFKEQLLPLTYRHVPNTVVLVDQNDNPVVRDNGDGTWSGLSLDLLYKEPDNEKEKEGPRL